MKNFKTFLLILLISMAGVPNLFAQQMEDVVYLKNGNVYRGVIVEQVPNVSIKIQTIGGNIFLVPMEDVEKITKESKVRETRDQIRAEPPPPPQEYANDNTKPPYQPRKSGYFFNAQVLIENLQGGIRIVNGYKFNQFAYLGVGIGVDIVHSTPHVSSNNFVSTGSYSGAYFPIYLFYSGDILNKRVTPFYALEVGYASGPVNEHTFEEEFNNDIPGGAIGGLGVGVKLRSKHRVNFSLLLNVNVKQLNFIDTYTYYDEFGNSYTLSERVEAVLFFPGIRLGIGF